jgi:hypothetical protein
MTNVKQELTANQKKLIAALRSGKYTQGKGKLRGDDGFCCLGVAAQEFVTDKIEVFRSDDPPVWYYEGEELVAPPYVVKALGLLEKGGMSRSTNNCLTDLNDAGVSFSEIADLLEAEPEEYFAA